MRVRRSRSLLVALAGAWLASACGGSAAVPDAGPSGASVGSAPATSGASADVADSIALLRPDARTACAPSTGRLPGSAHSGVECLVATEPVARVEVFAFDNVREAARAYLRTIDAAGIRPRSGTCESGKGGDGAWAPGDDPRDVTAADGVAFQGEYFIPERYGCFVEDGIAHAIATCGKHLVEVIGMARPLEPVHTWVWTYADDSELDEPVPPGICTGT